MKTSFFLLASLGLSFSLQGCMTAQDRLNWDETVRWYKGTPAASKSDETKAEAEATTEPKVMDAAPSVEAPAEAKAIESAPSVTDPEQK